MNNLYSHIEEWVFINRKRVLLFISIVGVLGVFNVLPYFNWFFSASVTLFLILVLVILVFRVRKNSLILLTGVLLFVAWFLLLVNEQESAEIVGNYVFGLLVLIFFGEMISLGKEQKKG